MADEFFMFDSVDGDREVTAQDFADYFNELITTGVFYRNNLPSLKVHKGTGLNTSMDLGAAYVEGRLYRRTKTPKVFTHATGNPSFPRIDRIVIRLDSTLSNRNALPFIKEGTPATNPQPPALQRDDFVFEISLAQVRINAGASIVDAVTDERMNQNLCGIASSIIQVPTSDYEAEWREFMDLIMTGSPALGGMTISVDEDEPTAPNEKDIWIDLS